MAEVHVILIQKIVYFIITEEDLFTDNWNIFEDIFEERP